MKVSRTSLAQTKTRILLVTATVLIYILPAPLPTYPSTRDETAPPKPIMSTFFEPVPEGCCGMTERGHLNLVATWEKSWQSVGWTTRILKEEDARKHPRFEELDEKLEKAGVSQYDRRCFWRWLAMAMDEDGGWVSAGCRLYLYSLVSLFDSYPVFTSIQMVDYDFFPLTLTPSIGQELASTPGFKSWSVHVPTLIHADHDAWNVITDKMIDIVDKDLEVEFISDMYLLRYLHNNFSEKELSISSWESKAYPGFPYMKNGDYVVIDCPGAKSSLGAHLSHSSTHMAVNAGLFPKVQGIQTGDLESHMERRAEAAEVMLKEVRDKCLK